ADERIFEDYPLVADERVGGDAPDSHHFFAVGIGKSQGDEFHEKRAERAVTGAFGSVIRVIESEAEKDAGFVAAAGVELHESAVGPPASALVLGDPLLTTAVKVRETKAAGDRLGKSEAGRSHRLLGDDGQGMNF